MKKCILFLFIIIATNYILVAQDKKNLALEYFNKGLKMFKQKKYKEADSIFSISAKIHPFSATFYNLARTKYYLKDICGYCNNLDSAAQYGDMDAQKLFFTNCKRRDSINYDNNLHKDSIFYSIIETETCSNKKQQYFFIKNLNNGELTGFYILSNDSLKNEEEDFNTKFPDLNKISYERVTYITDGMPVFPGGENALLNFIANNLIYPKDALSKGIQGKVFVYFVINKEGGVEQIEIKQSIHPLLDEEAIRVVKLMPKWKPGIQKGKLVKVAFTVPINFSLQKE